MTETADTFTIHKKTVLYTAVGILGFVLVLNLFSAFAGGMSCHGMGMMGMMRP